jgi:predicted dehydrogenase
MLRRQFLGTTVGAGAAAAASMVWSSRTARAANADDIRVAVIGFNSRGQSHLKDLGNHVVALCDVDAHVLSKSADKLAENGQKVDKFTDFRKLLEQKNIDAVSIATPNHTHALIAVLAAQAGKDVYLEKPVSHNVWEGRQIVAAAKRYGRIIQTGTQSRSSDGLRDAAAWIQAGNLGAIKYALGTCYKRRPSIGKQTRPLQIPSFIDRDLWIAGAKDQPIYRPEKNSQGGVNPHYDWHWDYNTGCGDLGNQGIHQMDIARWFLGEKALAPKTVSIGGRFGYEDAGNTPNTQIILHQYAKAPLLFEVRGLPKASGTEEMDRYRGSRVGVVVQCEKGSVLIPNYTEAIAYDNDGKEIKHWYGDSEHGRHHQNWLDAIAAKDAKILRAPITEGHRSSALCHVGNVSYRLGEKKSVEQVADAIKSNELLADSFKRMLEHLKANDVDLGGKGALMTLGQWLTIDPETETFVNNDKATALRSREYRKPFAVPDVERELAGQAAAAG